MRPMIMLLVLAGLALGQVDPMHPNVLLVIGDDLGSNAVGSFAPLGSAPASTPTIDAIAGLGVTFRAAYSQCVCAPTRVAMLSGRQAFRTGIGTGIPWDNPSSPNGQFAFDLEAFVPLPSALQSTHSTAAFGKWHMSSLENRGVPSGSGWDHPVAVGFDHFFGTAQNVGASGSDPGNYFDWEWNTAGPRGSSQEALQGYLPTLIVDAAAEWIADQGAAPWFAWVAFHNAHAPAHVPPADLQTIGATESSSGYVKHRAMVEALDAELGRLIASLRPAVLANTWVIYVSDNGDAGFADVGSPETWPPPGKDKPDPWEGNVRMPLAVWGPAVAAGTSSDQVVHVVDLFATVCDLAGVRAPPTAVDSVSVAGIISGASSSTPREVAYVERFRPNGFGPYVIDDWAVSDGRWKALQKGPFPLRLFDLLHDFGEADNLLDDLPLDAEAAAALEGLLDAREELLR